MNAEPSSARRRARGWRRALIAVVVVVALLAAAEVAQRLILPGVIATAIRSELGLTTDHAVTVELGGLVTPHTVTGRVGDVDVAIDDVPIVQDLVGDVRLHADEIPFSPTSAPMSGGSATITFDKEQLDPAITLVTGGLASSGTVRGGEFVVGRQLSIFDQDVTISVPLSIDVSDGDVVITPGGLSAAGFDFTSEQIAQFAGGALDPLLSTHTVCIRDRLPAGITVTDVALSSTGSVSVSADLSPGILSDPSERDLGTCPAT